MNSTFYSQNDYRNYLAHFGVKGMKWGVRRFQNANGSYTSAGKRRYGVGDGKAYKSVGRGGKSTMTEAQRAARRAKIKKAALAVGGAAALAGGAYLAAKYGGNTRAGRYVRNAAIAGAMNARQMGRNVRTAALRTAGRVAYSNPGQAIGRGVGRVAGAAGGVASRAGAAASRAGRFARNAGIAGAMNARQYASRAGDVAARAGSAASRAGRFARNAGIAGAANARQAGRNLRTAALRGAGRVAYSNPGQAIGRGLGRASGAAGGVASRARSAASRAGQFARNAGISRAASARQYASRAGDAAARVRSAASRAGRYTRNASIAGAANVRQKGRNLRTAAMRGAGAIYNGYNNRRRRR